MTTLVQREKRSAVHRAAAWALASALAVGCSAGCSSGRSASVVAEHSGRAPALLDETTAPAQAVTIDARVDSDPLRMAIETATDEQFVWGRLADIRDPQTGHTALTFEAAQGVSVRFDVLREAHITASALSGDTRTLIIATRERNDTRLHVLDVSDPATVVYRYQLADAWLPAYEIAFTPDGRSFITDVPEVRFWDIATGELVRTLESHDTLGCVVSPDGRWLAAYANSPVMHTEEPDGSRAYFDGDAQVVVWELPAGDTGRSLAHVLAGDVTALVFHPRAHDTLFVVSSGSPFLQRVDLGGEGDGFALDGVIGVSAAISPDGRTLAIGGTDRAIHLYDTRDGRALQQIEGMHGEVHTLAFTADGAHLLVLDRKLRRYAVTTER